MTLLAWFVLIIVSLIILSLLFWRYWFCRRPKRKTPKGDVVVSPANGTVAVVQKFDTSTVKVKKWNKGSVEFLARDVAKKGWFVLIVMTPMHVHFQRAPMKGEVMKTHHEHGKFFNAVKDAEKLLTLQNERNEILMKTKHGKIKIVQIAGVLARRIICHVHKNEKVEKGSVIGFINLGSQVALLLSSKAKVLAKPGDVVVDGETVIAKW
ncbi:phosphatidylserine decarboxylase family protein [Candidatus Woesearchaeota archaeon]|nr:phosphatidylserine decarboxylase family protein [Candidatus Woesearchaeota archaeon]